VLDGEAPVGDAQVARLERALDDDRDLVDVEGLGEVVVGAGLHGGDREALRAVRREQDDGQRGVACVDGGDELEPAHARHLEVGEHDLGVVEAGQRFGAGARGDHRVPAIDEHLAEREQDAGLVVDEQDLAHAAGSMREEADEVVSTSAAAAAAAGRAGRRIVTVVPRPGSLA
jgi:hypothetical protein